MAGYFSALDEMAVWWNCHAMGCGTSLSSFAVVHRVCLAWSREGGGVLIAVAETGTRDELGQPRSVGVLEKLCGIDGWAYMVSFLLLDPWLGSCQ